MKRATRLAWDCSQDLCTPQLVQSTPQVSAVCRGCVARGVGQRAGVCMARGAMSVQCGSVSEACAAYLTPSFFVSIHPPQDHMQAHRSSFLQRQGSTCCPSPWWCSVHNRRSSPSPAGAAWQQATTRCPPPYSTLW